MGSNSGVTPMTDVSIEIGAKHGMGQGSKIDRKTLDNINAEFRTMGFKIRFLKIDDYLNGYEDLEPVNGPDEQISNQKPHSHEMSGTKGHDNESHHYTGNMKQIGLSDQKFIFFKKTFNPKN